MGDLDSILQDFSYLKSLEHKNQAPKTLSPKLYLPDPSVAHAIRILFENTGEAVFERIFNRPLGYRCFQDFVSGDYGKADKVAKTLFDFNNDIKDLSSDAPAKALEKARELKAKYLDNAEVIAASVFADEALSKGLAGKLDKLHASLSDASSLRKVRNVNIKEFFTPFQPQLRAYLAARPWAAFKESSNWIRYCQWKHLEANMKVSEKDFDVHRILGRGGFGEVFGCRKHDTGNMFAMKKLDKRRLKSKHQESSAVHERNVLAEMHSKFVTNLKYAFHDKDTLYLILDLMEGGDLSWHLKQRETFSEAEAKFYAAEIVLGLAHIHSRNMIYRDLKPANILLDGMGHARISDLGLVRDMSKSLPTSECGTHGYMSPEVLTPDTPYDQGADWWSLGCVVYQFLVGYSPFRGPEKTKITKEEIDRRTHTMAIAYPDHITPEARDLISQLLDRNPKTRLGCRGRGAAELRAHAWFEAVDWPAMLDHKVPPPIRPSSNQVNANDVYEIDRFDTWDMRRVAVTPEDNKKYYANFDHIMSHYWQEEILGSVYDQIVKRADATEAKNNERIRGRATEPELSGALMQGYLLKKGGMMGAWKTRYFALFGDRLEWRMEQRQPVRRAIQMSAITSVEERTDKDAITIVITSDFPRPLEIRARHASDHKCWLTRLKAAVAQDDPPVSPTKPRASVHAETLETSVHPRVPVDPDMLEDELKTPMDPCPPTPVSPGRTISQTSAGILP
eukprot:m.232160 g.232160  ORF g.232160 m.232160 type:complete len:734 (+) comp12307_c0_seq1:159-2360(+)